MLIKFGPEFGTYARSFKKAVKGLIQAGFFGEDVHFKLIDDGLTDDLVADVFAEGIEYRKVTEIYTEYPSLYTTYYIVDGEDTPMTFAEIYAKYNLFDNCFVAICRKKHRSLRLTGFVF